MAQKVDLNIRPREVNPPVDKRSDTVYIFEFEDESEEPLMLVGFSARMELRHYRGAKTVLDTLSTQNGRLQITENKVYVKFPHEVTATYKFDKAVYDILLETPSGEYRVVEGEIEFNPEVTR